MSPVSPKSDFHHQVQPSRILCLQDSQPLSLPLSSPSLKVKGSSLPLTVENIWQDGQSGERSKQLGVFLRLCVPSPQTYQCVSSQTQGAKEESRVSWGGEGSFPQPQGTQWGAVTAGQPVLPS